MNEIIESLFSGFKVGGVSVPVVFLRYLGHGEPYVTYMQTDAANGYGADDFLGGYVEYWDFDVYSTGNYFPIIAAIKEKLKSAGFIYQPSRSSQDFYEDDTKYYHKTLCFAIHRQEV